MKMVLVQTRLRLAVGILACLCTAAFPLGCQPKQPQVPKQLADDERPAPQFIGEKPGIHNLIRLTDKLYTGSSPSGPAGFNTLKELGVQTILSVDGAKPDVETAAQLGIHYIHLPIGYDAIPPETTRQIARIVHNSDRPIFIHCHHGKHRGPAAAIAALRCLDSHWGDELTKEYLLLAKTDPHYRGLYRDVLASQPIPKAELSRPNIQLPAVQLNPVSQAMVKLDEHWDEWKEYLKQTDADWAKVQLKAADTMLLIVEDYREMERLQDTHGRPADYKLWLTQSREQSEELLKMLQAEAIQPLEVFRQKSRAVSQLCTRCHNAYRDNK